MNVYNERKISKIFNVIGMIRGQLEPGNKIIQTLFSIVFLEKFSFQMTNQMKIDML